MPPGDANQLTFIGGDQLPSTPIRRQYLEIKAAHPDAILFFRLGDFFETFDEDAHVTAAALDIALTSRDIGRGERVPMAGVPCQAAAGHIARLLERGHRVALCEQIGEAPARGLVRREVVRVMTPGTVVEDELLPPRANNYLAALVFDNQGAGLAHVDVSTGELAVTEVVGRGWEPLLAAEMIRLGPSECLISDELAGNAIEEILPPGARPTLRSAASFASHRALDRLKGQFGTSTLGGLGLDDRPRAARATGALLEYVEHTVPAALSLLDRLSIYDIHGAMVLDAATRRSLELTENPRTGGRQGTLLEVVDETRTPMGARTLRRWVSSPLLDAERIEARLDAVDWLVGDASRRDLLSDALASLPDLERLSVRAAQRMLSPREALALASGLAVIPPLREMMGVATGAFLTEIRRGLRGFAPLVQQVGDRLTDPPPATFGEGVIRAGCSGALDQLRSLSGDARGWIAELERTERERTGVGGLRVGYNRVFGYYLEASKQTLARPTDYYQREATATATIGDHLQALGYSRRQTLTSVERFVMPRLQDYELRVRSAQEELGRIERRLFDELVDVIAGQAGALRECARAVARLDVVVGLASVAVRHRYCRPTLAEGDQLELIEARHPVVERSLAAGGFVPNDARLGDEHGQIAILTGPNMAGKSTYLRQVALVVLLAQIGSFVPAARAQLGLVDRVFARVGAHDDLAAHRSTFMIEMIETANILRSATSRSLLILDEIGRGTSTFDGIAVARAVVEHIHDSPRLGCKTVFATHYHELAELEKTLPRARSVRMDVLERGGRVVFLHQIVPGAADRSYGVYVARLAGLPESVTRRATSILRELEQRGAAFETANPATPVPAAIDVEDHPVLRRLADLDPMRMTPLEALSELTSLADLARLRARA